MASVLAGTKRPFATVAADWGPYEQQQNGSNGKNSPGPPRAYDSVANSRSSSVLRLAAAHDGDAAEQPMATTFEPDATIVLAGIRGVGKSTLAVIASAALKRKVVDTEKAFLEATTLPSPAYKKHHGVTGYQDRQSDILRDLLQRNKKNAVVVCSWMERGVQSLLRDFSKTNPVVYVTREAKAIKEHLKIWDDNKVLELLDFAGSVFRRCANFEFFNVSEDSASILTVQAAPDNESRYAAPYLTLKRAERHFLKFLSVILPRGAIPFIESAFPLASIPTENRQFTYATSIPLSKLLERDVDIEELETGADAIQIVVDDLVQGNRLRGYGHEGTPNGDVAVPRHSLQTVRTDSEPEPNIRGEKLPGIQDVSPVNWSSHGQLSSHRASDISRVIGNIRRSTIIPVLYHVVFPEDSSNHEMFNLYASYVNHGLRLAPEYATVDLRLDDDLIRHITARRGHTKVIGNVELCSPNPPSWTSSMWISFYRKAQNLQCSLVRLTKLAVRINDNFEVGHLRATTESLEGPKLPLIAFCTGPKGRNSACFNQILTAVLPDGHSQEAARDASMMYRKPAMTAFQATQALYQSFVYDPMKLYVFGANVDYSLSPAMQNAAFKACGIPHYYRAHSTGSINGITNLINDPRFAGASIGLPYKVEIISLTHSLSRHAKAIGAVNTLIPIRQLAEDGSIPEDALLFDCRNRAGPVKALYGENTDWIAIRACIRRGLSPANAVRPSSSALVIGAGGMARAAVYAMLQLGVKNIVVFNRTAANAERLVAHFTRQLASADLPLLSDESGTMSNGGGGELTPTRFHVLGRADEPWPAERGFRLPTIVVSCIPTHSIGDGPGPTFSPPGAWLDNPTGGVVVELAYRTLTTPLLEQSRRRAGRGWVTMDGLDLLPEQGFAQFELFTGRRAPRRLMRREIFRAYPDEQGRSNLASLQPRLDYIVEQEP